MRTIKLEQKRYKLPSSVHVPSQTPFPNKVVKRGVPGTNYHRSSLFARIPDQSPGTKALLSIPQSKVTEKIASDYTSQAKAMDKSKLDGVKMNEDLIFEAFDKLKKKKKATKKKPKKSEPKQNNKKKKGARKKNKNSASPDFSISS